MNLAYVIVFNKSKYMSDPTISAELIKAVPVVVGGVLAVLGGVLGQLKLHIASRHLA